MPVQKFRSIEEMNRVPVADHRPQDFDEFSGRINWVQIDLERDDHDHLISPEERFRVAMARQ